jgi:hypothetical protein
MAENTMVNLFLYRTGPDEKKHEKGYLEIPTLGKTFTTRERGDGYVSLRIGQYKMKHSTKIKGRQVKCLRPVEDSITTMLIHDADKDNPATLEGCIAPGKVGGEANWTDSAGAMEELWSALGGWEEGKEVILNVMTNVSYRPEGETRNDWGRVSPYDWGS